MNLRGTRALITGATSGIGEAIAVRLASEGAIVVASGRNVDRGSALIDRLPANENGTHRFIPADLETVDGPTALASAAEEYLGGVDILVNNAGVWLHGPSSDVDRHTLESLFRVNFFAPYLLSIALIPKMAERGNGAIVNITSSNAYRGFPGFAAYGASKAALDSLTKAWAAEFGKQGVRINAVSPGAVLTPGARSPSELAAFSAVFGLGRYGEPDEVAALVAFLVGPDGRYIHGSTVHIDGGLVETFGYQPIAILETTGSPSSGLEGARAQESEAQPKGLRDKWRLGRRRDAERSEPDLSS